MDPIKKPDDDGLTRIQRLSPDQFDVVLGSHPSKRKPLKPAKTGSFGRTLLVLAALGIGAYALIPHSHTDQPAVSVVSPQPSEAVPSEPAAASVAPVATAAPVSKVVTPAPEPIVIFEQDSAPEVTAATPPAKPAQGMVSAEYMAEYKRDLAHSSSQKRQVASLIQTVMVRERNGSNRYEAKWRIFNNHIENDSVCYTYPANTGEHIECRKAALEYFTDQCQEWTKRMDDDKADQIKQTQTRFCEAAKSFNPAG